jgi:type VI secretion system protein ImpF
MSTPRTWGFLPSVLDRLLDDDPTRSHEPAPRHGHSLQQLIQAVRRDLEHLLNTRQALLEDLPAAFPEAQRSLLTYGLPDLTALSLQDPHDRTHIRRALEQAITLGEPRLLRVRVTLETPGQPDQVLHFRIEAFLRVEPAPEPVTFDALLRTNQEYVVQGAA